MDIQKVGRFLASLRHEKAYTQEELGEKLGVSNKTVSRWENGNYLPPVEMLLELGRIYGVSINELLSGQRLLDGEYKEKAEENIQTALKSSTFTLEEKISFYKKKWLRDHKALIGLSVLIVAVLFAAGLAADGILYTPRQLLNLGIPGGIYFAAAIIAGLLLYMGLRNKMMIYVEAHAFRQE